MPPVDDISLPIGFLADLTATRSIDEVHQVAADWLSNFVESHGSSVSRLTPDGLGLEVLPMKAELTIPAGTVIPIEGTVVGMAYTTQQTVRIADLCASPLAEAKPLCEVGYRACVVAPLLSSDECFGTLNVVHRTVGGFSAHDEQVLSTVAALLGSFVRNHLTVETEQREARTDPLTKLLSRRAIIEELERRLNDNPNPPAVIFIDLDGFKTINDAYGHSAGDEMLRTMASRLDAAVRSSDSIGRLGGDEFLIVCDLDRGGDAAVRVAERLAATCSEPVFLGTVSVAPRMSIGVAQPRSLHPPVEELLADADMAMYEAKRSGQTVMFANDDLRQAADLVTAIDRDLETALRRGEISFHYLPVCSLDSKEILGAEALVRWDHPTHGRVPAHLLVERAEATGLMDQFTAWTVEEASAQLAQLRALCLPFVDKQFSINLTARQLAWSAYPNVHLAALERNGLNPGDLIVEIVESGLIELGSKAEQNLRTLAEQGVTIALDDFGDGHNALTYFTRFPIHAIKFDRTLIGSMVESDAVQTIVKGLAHMASELDIDSLGEGIETEAERELCRELGMRAGQGHLLGAPMTLDELAERVATGGAGTASASAPAMLGGSQPSSV